MLNKILRFLNLGIYSSIKVSDKAAKKFKPVSNRIPHTTIMDADSMRYNSKRFNITKRHLCNISVRMPDTEQCKKSVMEIHLKRGYSVRSVAAFTLVRGGEFVVKNINFFPEDTLIFVKTGLNSKVIVKFDLHSLCNES